VLVKYCAISAFDGGLTGEELLVPTRPREFPSVVVVNVYKFGAGLNWNVITCVPVVPAESDAVIVTAAVEYAAFGVPETTPVDALRERPPGRVPFVTAYVSPAPKPTAVTEVGAIAVPAFVPVRESVAGTSSPITWLRVKL
jgi:hypothetical protein